MKIRNGFVSNSSSSSFCILVEKEWHTATIDRLPNFFMLALDYLGVQSDNAFGKDIVKMAETNTPGGSCWDDFYCEDDDARQEFVVWCKKNGHWSSYADDEDGDVGLGILAFEVYVKEVLKNKDLAFTVTVDF